MDIERAFVCEGGNDRLGYQHIGYQLIDRLSR